MKRIITNKIRCRKCGDIIESKYTHDYVSCSCGSCAVDGGYEYLRRTGELEDFEELSESLGDDSDLDELNSALMKNREYYIRKELRYPIVITMPAFGAEPKIVDVPDFDITVQCNTYSEAIEKARGEVCARLRVLRDRNEPFPKPTFIDDLKCGRYQMPAFMGVDIDEFATGDITGAEHFPRAVFQHKDTELKTGVGFPKYSRNDKVRFENVGSEHEGVIVVVNGHGIFGLHDQPYYDILADNEEQTLFKNIPESSIINIAE